MQPRSCLLLFLLLVLMPPQPVAPQPTFSSAPTTSARRTATLALTRSPSASGSPTRSQSVSSAVTVSWSLAPTLSLPLQASPSASTCPSASGSGSASGLPTTAPWRFGIVVDVERAWGDPLNPLASCAGAALCASIGDAVRMASALLPPTFPSLAVTPGVVILVRAIGATPEGAFTIPPNLPFLTIRPFSGSAFGPTLALTGTVSVRAPGFAMHGFSIDASGIGGAGPCFDLSEAPATLTNLTLLALSGPSPAIAAAADFFPYPEPSIAASIGVRRLTLANCTLTPLPLGPPPAALLTVAGDFEALTLSNFSLTVPTAMQLVNCSGITAGAFAAALTGVRASGLLGVFIAPPGGPLSSSATNTSLTLSASVFSALRCAGSCVGALLLPGAGAAQEGAGLSLAVSACAFSDVASAAGAVLSAEGASSVAGSNFTGIAAPLGGVLYFPAPITGQPQNLSLTASRFTNVVGPGLRLVGFGGASVTVAACSFVNVSTTLAAPLSIASVAISGGVFSITGCVFANTSSSAVTGGGAVFFSSISQTVNLTLVGSTFTGTTASTGPGGAVAVNMLNSAKCDTVTPARSCNMAVLRITACAFSSTVAGTSGGALAATLGATSSANPGGRVFLSGTPFMGCSASAGDGGAVYIALPYATPAAKCDNFVSALDSHGGSVILSAVVVTGTRAAGNGGGIAIVSGCQGTPFASLSVSALSIANTSARLGSGGGLYISAPGPPSSAELAAPTQRFSYAFASISIVNASAGLHGGGLYVDIHGTAGGSGVGPSFPNANLNNYMVSLSALNITACSSPSGSGGGGYFKAAFLATTNVNIINCSAGEDGGGLYVLPESFSIAPALASTYSSRLTTQALRITACRALRNGGGAHFVTAAADTVFSTGARTDNSQNHMGLQVTGCTAGASGGGLFLASVHSPSGSAVARMDSLPDWTFSSSALVGNAALNGSGGGAFAALGSFTSSSTQVLSVLLAGCSLENNTASLHGGGLCLDWCPPAPLALALPFVPSDTAFSQDGFALALQGTRVAGNKAAGGSGGGIALLRGPTYAFVLANSSFLLRNSAGGGSGGGAALTSLSRASL